MAALGVAFLVMISVVLLFSLFVLVRSIPDINRLPSRPEDVSVRDSSAGS